MNRNIEEKSAKWPAQPAILPFITSFRSGLAARLPVYYGYMMVPVAMLAMIATSPGQTFLISVFNPFLREDLALSHSQLTGAYMFGTFIASLPQPYIGALMDRFGLRRVMFVNVVLFGFACLYIAQVHSLLGLFVAFLCLRMLGQGALGMLANNTVAMWFQDRLGTVSGLVSVGFSAGNAFIPPLVLSLIMFMGWRGTYSLLGVIVMLMVLPLLVFVYQNRPQDIGQQLDGDFRPPQDQASGYADPGYDVRAAIRTRSFWIFLACSVAWAMIFTAVTFNIIPVFNESGLSAEQAATTYIFLSLSAVVSQLVGGYLSDRLPLRRIAFASMFLLVSGIWLLMRLDTIGEGILYAVLMGLGQGLIMIVGSTVWVRYFGRTHLGKIRGVLGTASVAGSSVGPFIMGFTFDLFGSYQASLWFFFAMLIPILIATLWATPPSPVITRVERQHRRG